MTASAQGFAVAMLAGALRASTPFLYVSLGECLTEQAGRVNLGNEGALVLGAVAAYAAALHTGSPWSGVAAGAAAGAVLGAVHGLACALPRVNDVAMGLALMIAGTGLAFFVGKPYVLPQAPRLPPIALGAWSAGAGWRNAVQVSPLLPLGIAAAFAMRWFLSDTRPGLRLRLAGDSEDAARALGLPVRRIRLLATLCGSALAGIGGAFLSLVYPGSWNEGLSSGQGLMAVALVILARWNPLGCVPAALLFGAAGAIGPSLQAAGIGGATYLAYAAPHILTLAILAATMRPGRALRGMPGALSIAR